MIDYDFIDDIPERPVYLIKRTRLLKETVEVPASSLEEALEVAVRGGGILTDTNDLGVVDRLIADVPPRWYPRLVALEPDLTLLSDEQLDNYGLAQEEAEAEELLEWTWLLHRNGLLSGDLVIDWGWTTVSYFRWLLREQREQGFLQAALSFDSPARLAIVLGLLTEERWVAGQAGAVRDLLISLDYDDEQLAEARKLARAMGLIDNGGYDDDEQHEDGEIDTHALALSLGLIPEEDEDEEEGA